MFLTSRLTDFFLRFAIAMVIGLLFGWVLREVSYTFTPDKEAAQREPQRIDLVIPYGTADQVDQGVYNASLPARLTFVEGDMLVVKNEDKVAHQLGPLFVPPSTSSVLNLDAANNYSYTCSFKPDRYMGLTVLPRVTSGTRIMGMLAIGLPTGMMLAVYSYLLPGRKKAAGEANIAHGSG
jgi:hypothetical protein